MTEVPFKCEPCGLTGVKQIGPMDNVKLSFPDGKDLSQDCPVIADKFRRHRQLQGALWAHCAHLREAAAKARPKVA